MSATSTSDEFVPATQEELTRFMVDNFAGSRKTICPVGGRTASSDETADTIVATTELKRIVDYPARDMTITVEAGMRVSELQATLATERQRLPIDIAQAERATIGGALATNTSGPRRFGHGTFRDFVIGISAVDAEGHLFKSGGRVVKNVAGYDVCKLLVGSQGTLGIVSQVTLKLRPLADSTSLLWCELPSLDQVDVVLQRLLLSDARPVAIDVLNVPAARRIATAARLSTRCETPILCLGVEGSGHEVAWQTETLKREIVDCGVGAIECLSEPDSARLWEALIEFPTGADDRLTFQANLLPSKCIEFAGRATALGIATQIHAGNGIVIGHLPADVSTSERAKTIVDELRRLASSHHGNLIVLNCDPAWKPNISVCGDPRPNWELMRRLKRQLDPNGLLSPGRFVV